MAPGITLEKALDFFELPYPQLWDGDNNSHALSCTIMTSWRVYADYKRSRGSCGNLEQGFVWGLLATSCCVTLGRSTNLLRFAYVYAGGSTPDPLEKSCRELGTDQWDLSIMKSP